MNLNILLLAIALEESSNNPEAYNKKEDAHGLFQIRQCVLDDVNHYYNRAYTSRSCYNPIIAYDIAIYYFGIYRSRINTIEDYARLWNAGPSFKRKGLSIAYGKRVRQKYNHIRRHK